MPTEYYNYGLEKDVASKKKDGMYSGGYQFTTDQFFNAQEAGIKLGVKPENIEVVLRFEGDKAFKAGQPVQPVPSRGFIGGASQYEHSGRPKPVAVRKINERNWQQL